MYLSLFVQHYPYRSLISITASVDISIGNNDGAITSSKEVLRKDWSSQFPMFILPSLSLHHTYSFLLSVVQKPIIHKNNPIKGAKYPEYRMKSGGICPICVVKQAIPNKINASPSKLYFVLIITSILSNSAYLLSFLFRRITI